MAQFSEFKEIYVLILVVVEDVLALGFGEPKDMTKMLS